MGSGIQMLTGRTAKYVEAIIREGDDFDYYRWLRRVREEDGRLKSVAVSSSVHPFAPGPDHPAGIARNPGEFRDSATAHTEKHKSLMGQVIRGGCHGTK